MADGQTSTERTTAGLPQAYSREVADYRQSLYRKYLRLLTLHLNRVHGEEHSMRYWEIVVGPWLLHFIYHAHHQYMRLDPSRRGSRANQERFLIPYDFNTFVLAFDTADYARQLDEMLSSEVGDDGLHWELCYLDDRKLCAEAGPSEPMRLLRMVLKLAAAWLTPRLLWLGRATMVSPSIPPRAALRVWLASKFRVVPLFLRQWTPGDDKFVASPVLRTWTVTDEVDPGLPNTAEDEFDCALRPLVLFQMPIVHLEHYRRHREEIRRLSRGGLRVLFSAMGWHEDEAFKLLAAELMEQGVTLVGHQHGGVYGIAEAELPEYEQKVVDQFWTWGWTDSRFPSVRPFFSLKLSEMREKLDRERRRIRARGDILFVSTTGSRQTPDGSGTPNGEELVTYFQQQVRFLAKLTPDVRTNVVVRLHPSERYGWKQADGIRDAGLDVTFRRSEAPMTALAHARLVVVDANTTVGLEAYACSVPTVLFLDRNLWPLREEWTDLLSAMEEVGLLHQSPESAAVLVNQVAADPAGWWDSGSVVPVRERFRQTFARTSPNFSRDLARAILGAADDRQSRPQIA